MNSLKCPNFSFWKSLILFPLFQYRFGSQFDICGDVFPGAAAAHREEGWHLFDRAEIAIAAVVYDWHLREYQCNSWNLCHIANLFSVFPSGTIRVSASGDRELCRPPQTIHRLSTPTLLWLIGKTNKLSVFQRYIEKRKREVNFKLGMPLISVERQRELWQRKGQISQAFFYESYTILTFLSGLVMWTRKHVYCVLYNYSLVLTFLYIKGNMTIAIYIILIYTTA